MSKHGTSSRYHRGCRCTPCTAANAAACKAWRSRRRRSGPIVHPRARLYWPVEDDRYWLTLAGYAALSVADLIHSGDTGCAQGQAAVR